MAPTMALSLALIVAHLELWFNDCCPNNRPICYNPPHFPLLPSQAEELYKQMFMAQCTN